MKLTDELIEKIKEIFSNDIEMQNKLLNLDIETIRELGREANSNFTFDDVIECYESKTLDYLYKLAQKKAARSKLYFRLVGNGRDPYFLKREVNPMFKKKLTDKELSELDNEAIKELALYAKSGFTFDDIITSYESDSMDELYEEAKNKKRYSNFYFERVGEKSAIRK